MNDVDTVFIKTDDPNIYEVQIAFRIRGYGIDSKAKPTVLPIGTVRKFNHGISSPLTWEPDLGNQPLPHGKNRKAATEALIRAFVKDPKVANEHHLISKCRKIARSKGKLLSPHYRHTKMGKPPLPEGVSYREVQYEDDIIQIVAGVEHGGLEITRKPMPDKGMPGDNPCIMVDEWGICYRTHGESHYLDEHVEKLFKEIT